MIEQARRLARKLAAVALLAGAALAAWIVVAVPVAGHLERLAVRIESERAMLGRLAALSGQARDADKAERRIDGLGIEGAFLKGETEALQQAHLQALLKETAAMHQVRILSARALPVQARQELQLAGIGVSFNAPIDVAQSILHRLESQLPFMFVDGVDIEPVNAGATPSAAEDGVLQVNLRLFGVIQPKRKVVP